MADRLHLLSRHGRVLEALLRKHLPDVEVWAYGSRVNGRSHDGSDLDLVLRGSDLDEIPSGQLGDFEEAVRESNIPFLIEARDWARLPERFHREIERDHVVLVGKEDRGRDDERLFGSLPDEWEYTTLGIACVRGGGDIQTGPFGSQLHASDYVSNGIPSIMPTNIGDNRINLDGIAHISRNDAKRLSRYLVRAGDIVYSRRGDVKRRALVRRAEDGWLCGTGCVRVRLGENGVDSRYASYFLAHPYVQEWIVRHAHGATMPNLNTSILSECPFVIPPQREQRAIAHILGTLDDKIELNGRMNETLEGMARALFKSWFVDFGPVRAKMAGRDPDMPRLVADLFPDQLVDSELGEIPETWRVGCLAEISSAPARTTNPTRLRPETPYIGLEHMPRNSIALREWGYAREVASNKFAFDQGEVLFGKLRPYFHKVGVAPASGVCSTDIVVITPQAVAWSAFVVTLLSSAEFVAYADQNSTGTKMPRTSWETMARYRLCLPTIQVAQAFCNVVQPLINRIVNNTHESRRLAAVRNALLPELVSGKRRVLDAGSTRASDT